MINVLSKANLTFKSYNKCFYKLSCCNYSCLLNEKKIENKRRIVGNIGQQSARLIFSLPNPFRKKQSFRKIDRIPTKLKCVYISDLGLYVAYFYPFVVIFGALTTVSAACAILMNLKHAVEFPGHIENAATMQSQFEFAKAQFAAIGTASFAISSLVWTFARRMPLRIYFDEEQELFVASFATLKPWKTTNIVFEPGDVVEKYPTDEDTPAYSPKVFLGQYLLLEKQRIILFPDSFVLPYYYNLALGIHLQELSPEDPYR